MKKFLRARVLGPLLGLLLAGIQLFPPARSPGAADAPNDMGRKYAVPADVQRLLVAACYDCHSNRTRYPWYAGVQPVGWWLAHHVAAGRRHLDFSEFGALGPKAAARKLDVLSDQVDEDKMPLRSYTWMHPAARLTDAQRAKIVDWAQTLHDKLAPE